MTIPGTLPGREVDRTTFLLNLSEKMRMCLIIFGRLAATLISGLIESNDRRRSRSELMTLNDHELLDIGISESTAKFEGRKPFWRR
jgi:uncharacterized protein YjiS (DUF1127 family)